jgi:hypothetical protein
LGSQSAILRLPSPAVRAQEFVDGANKNFAPVRIDPSNGACKMSNHVCRTVACALALNIGALGASLAQDSSARSNLAPVGASADHRGEFESAPTTVLMMAPNGSWGAATNDSMSTAIAAAITQCKRRYQKAIGCGSYLTTIRGGWSLGIRCGSENILAAEKTLFEAEQAAIDRELELRRLYVPAMPPCVRLVSVDPSGAIVAPYAADLVRIVMRRRDGSSQ